MAKPFAKPIAAALILLALTACLHREVLFHGAVYHMDDAADNYYPARVAFRRALSEGTLPSWEKDAMGGWPLLTDPYYGYFYPLNFVFYLGKRAAEPPAGLASGVAAGLGLAVALHVWLGGLGMFVYLRRRKLSFFAALFGAIAFSLSNFFVVRIRHIIYVQAIAWVPWLLASIDGYIENGRRRALAAAALCTALLLLAGAHSLLHFIAIILGGYTIARLLRGPSAQTPLTWRWLALRTCGLGGAALCGLLLSSVALLPTLLAMPHTARALGTDYEFASSYAWPGWNYLQLLLHPDRFGIGEWRGSPNPWRGPWNHWELAGYYQGTLALFLAVPGALLRRPQTERLMLLVLGGLAVLTALGDAGPVHPWLFNHVPLYAALRCPARALCILVVALPILAAHAADALASFLPNRRLAALALFLLCATTVVDQYRIDRRSLQSQPADFAYGTERFAAIEWLQNEMTQHPLPLSRFVADLRGPFRLLSIGETLGLEAASGYSSMLVWRYSHLLYIINNGQPYPYPRLRNDLAASGLLRFDTPLVDMLNLRYLISSDVTPSKWREVFRPLPNAPPHARYEPMWDATLRVYENSQVLPRAYVAYQAQIAANEAAEAVAVARPSFDPHREIVLGLPAQNARAAPLPIPPIENRGRVHGRVEIRVHDRHRVVLEAEVAAPGVLVLADTYFPGWSATVDGVAQPIYPVNLAQRGVALSPGHHRVEMIYRDRALRTGGLLSLLGLFSLAALTFLRRRCDKKVSA